MKRMLKIALLLVAGCTLSAWQVADAAEKDHGKGNKQGKHDSEQHESRGEQSDNDRVVVDMHFREDVRVKAHDYYQREFSGKSCPPGLAKKNNGCMPPGQAKRWQRGERLPADVVYYDVPPALVIELGAPPRGARYVRVASDILMIAVGTSLVLDAIEDLDR